MAFPYRSVLFLYVLTSLPSRAQEPTRPSGGVYPSAEDVVRIPFEHPFVLPRRATIQDSVDLAPWFPPAGDQYKQASCGGWAIGYGVATYKWNTYRGRPSDPVYLGDPANVFSPGFVYNLTAVAEKNVDCSVGIQLPDAIELVCDTGCATWQQFPVDTSPVNCLRTIPDSALIGAYRHKMSDPLGLDNFNSAQWKYHLGKGEPIIFFVSISNAYFLQGFSTGGGPFRWNEPEPQGNEWNGRTGHIMVCTGYSGDTYRALNSWGLSWGEQGYVEIPDSVLTWSCSDAYVFGTGWATLPHAPLRPAKHHDLGDDEELKGSLVQGDLHATDSIAFRLIHASTDDQKRVVEVLDGGSSTHAHTLHLRLRQPVTLVHEGHFYTFTWIGRTFPGGRMRYVIRRNDPVQRAEVEHQLQTIDHHADGRVDGEW